MLWCNSETNPSLANNFFFFFTYLDSETVYQPLMGNEIYEKHSKETCRGKRYASTIYPYYVSFKVDYRVDPYDSPFYFSHAVPKIYDLRNSSDYEHRF